MQLKDLRPPQVIEVFTYEEIKQRKIERLKQILVLRGVDYNPSESDDLMTMLEVDAYEEVLLRERINNVAKANLLAFAEGADLDHIAATIYGETRLIGSKPYASFTFTLSLKQENDIVLPAGLSLGDGSGIIFSTLLKEVIIKKGELSADGVVQLEEAIESSDIKTEIIITPLAFVAKAKQNERFHDGMNAETDDRFRERTWLSREKKSTAGSFGKYKYYTLSADARIKDAAIIDDVPGVVKIYLLDTDGNNADQVMIDRVNKALNKEEIRPLTDNVQVFSADIKEIGIKANLTLYDMTYENNVKDLAEASLNEHSMVFGRSLTMSKLIGLIESEQVKDVEILSPLASVMLQPHQVIKIKSITLNSKGVN